MRQFISLVVLLGLSGCESYVQKDGDWFEVAGHSAEQFDRDNQSCRMQADDHLSYDLDGGTPNERNRILNRVYSQCMAAHRYRPRPYWKNWLPG